MEQSQFVYVTYIRTTPEKLWEALTEPEFTKQYWFGVVQECAWEKGSPWRLVLPDGRVPDSGEVLEIDPPRKLVLRWLHEFGPGAESEGDSLCTWEIEQTPDAVKLTVSHTMERAESRTIKAVSGGWPKILAGLKSLLETGAAFGVAAKPPCGG